MFWDLILPLFIPAALVLFFRILNKPYKPAIFGVYQQRNKFFWIKYIFMYLILSFRQLVNHIRRILAVETGKSSDGVQHVHKQDEVLENKYYLGDHAQAIDAVYLNGCNKDGDAVICGIARRPKHVVDAFLFLKVKGEDLLLSPELPDTYQEQVTIEEGYYRVKGLEIANFIPMRTWKLTYNGDMKVRNDTEKTVKVELELTWSAVFSHFNYDTQMSPKSMARDLAKEKWSRGYFKLLKKNQDSYSCPWNVPDFSVPVFSLLKLVDPGLQELQRFWDVVAGLSKRKKNTLFHQTHYEQMGVLEGTVTIDGKDHTINIPCVRDHSFGPFRDWKTFHRYVYHFIFLENGDCMAIGSVCQPAVLSHLTIGYLCRQSDQSVLPVEFCDFQLYQHGEHQILPKDYGFCFEAGGKTYAVRVQVDDEETFYIGKSREAKFYERWCSVEINGVKGSACVEWHYNNVQANSKRKNE